MNEYICHKRVKAAQILDIDYLNEVKTAALDDGSRLLLDPKITARYSPVVGDYLVEYEDGYRSISPKAAFESGYAPAHAPPSNGIGWAMEQMEAGKRVARAGWNGKGMWLTLVPGSRVTVTEGRPLAAALPVGTEFDYLPHVDMWTAQGQLVPWLCSQTDLQAKDWGLAE